MIGKNSLGLCLGRVRSSTYVLWFNTCFNTCFNMSFDICFNTGFSACFNLFQQPNQFFVHRFRTQSTFSAQIPISASAVARIIVSCSKNAHARRGLQEPPGRVIAPLCGLFATWGAPFFEQFFDLVFSQFLSQKRPQKRAKIDEKRSRKTKSKMRVEKVRKNNETRPPA